MLYSEEIMKHFLGPENVGRIVDADGIGEAGSVECGDFLKIYIKVYNNVIEDIKFEVFGCSAAIATSSKTTVLAKGKTIMEAYKINEKDIIEAVGGLPKEKEHCSVLGATALKAAIDDYKKQKPGEVDEK